MVQAFKPDAALKNLALSALTAIYHETILIVLHDKRGKTTFNGRGRGRRA
jgi:hypothetical protein